MPLILGISALYHDSAAALLRDGKITGAVQEERFSRRKHDSRFPEHAIRWCLSNARVHPSDIDHVVFYEKPFLKFERLLETYLAFAPRGFRSFSMAMPGWLRDKLFLKDLLASELRKIAPDVKWEDRILFSEHHLSHAASAFYPSPFEDAAVLTLDGTGEWTTTSLAIGRGNALEIQRELHFPHSLGLLYSAFTYYTGFKVNSGEYKLMGLAPYGTPRYATLIRDHLIDVKPDGSFRLNMKYFDYCTGLTMTSAAFDALFGGPPRKPEAPLEQRHMDLAASIQAVTEEVLLALTRSIAAETKMRDLCLAGGVALNCVANGRILEDGHFERIWIQPAAGDAGGALGAALAAHHLTLGAPRAAPREDADGMQGAFLGPEFQQHEIEERLWAAGATFEVLDDNGLFARSADDVAAGKALGWFQGRAEFGPRSLGNRSIIADPRSPAMQSQLNLKVKFRESFRPFAPAVLKEDQQDWFALRADSPYMLLVAQVAASQRLTETAQGQSATGFERLATQRSSIPAVTHVDGSARVQTVCRSTHPRFHRLISEFKSVTGCPVLVNTSFNVRGEPPVLTPEDAFRCFMGTDVDVLAIGNCYLTKEQQPPALLRHDKPDHAAD
ncbi:MAG TPA: carbamoyltransferase [Burkholderiaceae bacterium]|nr:carbamoyltransferase [Burkholderiaceae bacterium]